MTEKIMMVSTCGSRPKKKPLPFQTHSILFFAQYYSTYQVSSKSDRKHRSCEDSLLVGFDWMVGSVKTPTQNFHDSGNKKIPKNSQKKPPNPRTFCIVSLDPE